MTTAAVHVIDPRPAIVNMTSQNTVFVFAFVDTVVQVANNKTQMTVHTLDPSCTLVAGLCPSLLYIASHVQ